MTLVPFDTLLNRPRRPARAIAVVVVLLAIAGVVYLFWGGSAQQQRQGGPGKNLKIPVTVAAVVKKDVPLYLSGLGSVVPLNTVTVKSRVEGHLMEVLFKEGQMVQAGDLLALIDSRPFQAQLAQAQGQMARDKAQLENARKDLKRYQDLISTGAIAKQQLDTQEALVRQYEGATMTDQGQMDNAKLQIAYSRITAPISGRVGLRQIDPGNMIQSSNQALLVITQMQPVSVVFTLPEDNLPVVLSRMKKGGNVPVEAYDREQKRKLAQGELITVDNQIDATTGTVKLKAMFSNDGWELFPNQFVNARLLVDTLAGALVVPAQAVQRGPQGATAFVVNQGGTVEARRVEPGETVEGMTVVRSGLSVGEQVVVEGTERLRDGTPVEVRGQAGGGRQGG
ncbi:MAG: MdtA/MuxA family multidrug efflux RND transporter periplasmic adaptor subunit [Desulfovibrio sp.]|nr:MdtA/MuxA family multidrug efflux RND transporter periplasmic adaptor subunit [Desulfovibrio sp.]MBI4960920.1 MdtA/MuxA family multidrug efflux RND transporter periplasmic adaptor subunit [Desulfovibrio sp.]